MNESGMLGMHMLQHIFLMNLVAPSLSVAARKYIPSTLWRTWPWSAVLQLLLLWGWHGPPLMKVAMTSQATGAVMQLSLFLVALWFWSCVVTVPGTRRWQAVFALLITGKLFCLLGVLLIFARTGLYGTSLEDQQFAGLVMVAICPLTYVAAGVVITARWFLELELRAGSHD